MHKDEQARDAVEETGGKAAPAKSPPAGPHAKKGLTDTMKTPGTGLLPERKEEDVNASSG